MAANKSQVNALIQRHIIPSIADNFHDLHPLLWELERKHRMVEEDETFSFPILKGRLNTFKGYIGLEDITPAASPDIVTDVEYVMAHFENDFLVPFTDALRSRGPASVKSYLELYKEAAQLDMAEGLAVQLWTDQDAGQKQLLGVPRIVSAGTNAVGGLTSTQFSKWAPTRVAAQTGSTAESLGLGNIRSATIGATFGMDRPDIALCNRAVYTKLLSLFDSAYRLEDPAVARAGWESVNIMGINYYMDPDATGGGNGANDNLLVFLNTRWLRWAYNPADYFASRPIGDNLLSVRAVGAQYFVTVQFCCIERRKQAVVHTIDPAK